MSGDKKITFVIKDMVVSRTLKFPESEAAIAEPFLLNKYQRLLTEKKEIAKELAAERKMEQAKEAKIREREMRRAEKSERGDSLWRRFGSGLHAAVAAVAPGTPQPTDEDEDTTTTPEVVLKKPP